MPIRRTPPTRTFRLASIADDRATEDDMAKMDYEGEYDPEVVAQVLRAAEGPERRLTVEELLKELGISDDD